MAGEFAGHASDSTSAAIYENPAAVAPADRLYAPDGDSNGKPDVYGESVGSYSSQPGAPARANGYPRSS